MSNRTITVAAVQTSYGPDMSANIAKTAAFVREAARSGAQVVLPSELFQGIYFCTKQDPKWFETAYPVAEHPCVIAMQKLAKELRVVIPISFFEKDGPRYYNSVAIADAGGAEIAKVRTSPVEAARDFFQAELNHFPDLETAAEDLWRRGSLDANALFASLARYLETTHRLRTQLMPATIMGSMIRRHDPHRGRVLLSEMLPASGRAFQLACEIAFLEHQPLIEAQLKRLDTADEDARSLARIGLINYFAGAVLLPYEPFLQAVAATRHDLAILGARFGASFEQLCHRLTTLQRPGAKGVPFFMIRLDAAGNVSKRFSANSLHFARFGGACPIWNVHHAFQAPGQILTQLAEMPDGGRYLSIARTVSKPWHRGPLRAAQYSIALGCEAQHAGQLVYADGIAVEAKGAADLIGITCRSCPRGDCAHRAFPAAHQDVPKTDFIRSDPLFAGS